MNRWNEPWRPPVGRIQPRGPPGPRRRPSGGDGVHDDPGQHSHLAVPAQRFTGMPAVEGWLRPDLKQAWWSQLPAHLAKIKPLASQWMLVPMKRFFLRQGKRGPPPLAIGWLRRKPPSFPPEDDPWL